MARKVNQREGHKNLLDEHFWQYYRLNKTTKPLEYKNLTKCYNGVRNIFRTMQEMMSDTTHGMLLKDFGAIVPKDSVIEVNKGLFRKESKVRNHYLFFFEKEWLAECYRAYFVISQHYKESTDIVREPKPHAIRLHRKKIRKD